MICQKKLQSEESILQKNHTGVDVVKLICAVLVIIIHTDPFRNWFLLDKIFAVTDKTAVPFFFIASGYFLFSKMYDTDRHEFEKYLLKWVKRLLIMYVAWFVLYLPYYLYISGMPKSILTALRVLFISGTSSQLWFLPALIFSGSVVYFLTKKFSVNIALMIGLILILSASFIRTYAELLPIARDWALIKDVNANGNLFFNNGITYGLFYVAFGCKCAASRERGRLSLMNVLLLGVALLLFLMEGYFATIILHVSSTANFFMAIPVSCLLFVIANSWIVPISQKSFFFIRKLSSASYNTHFIFIYVLELIGWSRYTLNMFLADTILTLLFCVLLILLSKKLRLLKYLY